MRAFDNSEFEQYKDEAKAKWGQTDAYKEHAEKTKEYSKEKWNNLIEEMNAVFAEFAVCRKNEEGPDSAEAQSLVKKLQNHITENYYHCTDEILAGIGQMYVLDERFKKNIDKHGKRSPMCPSQTQWRHVPYPLRCLARRNNDCEYGDFVCTT